MFQIIRKALKPKSCIMPKAVTPVQKSICATTALVGLAIGTYIGYEGFCMLKPQIMQMEMPDVHPPKCLDRLDEMSKITYTPNTRFVINKMKMLGYGTLAIITTSTYYMLTTRTFRNIRHTTECCNIIRSAGMYAIISPAMVMVTVFYIYCAVDLHNNIDANSYTTLMKIMKNDV